MADDPRTGKEEGEEEEEQEGKATDSTITSRGSASRKASQTVSDNDQIPEPESPLTVSQNVSPLATQSGSVYTGSVSPSLRKSPSRSDGTTAASPSLRRSPSRSTASQSVRQSPTIGSTTAGSKSLAPSSDSQSVSKASSPSKAGASSRSTKLENESLGTESEYRLKDEQSEAVSVSQPQSTANIIKNLVVSRKAKAPKIKGQSRDQSGACGSRQLFARRSPFVHNPPVPEERRARISNPQCPRDYIINLREDLADFQETHGLPRTRDYSFMSLGLSLAQETGRAIYSVFLMITELFPIIAIVSLILRFALDKVIEILETDGTVPRIKKTALFTLQIIIIMIPLWILVATIIIPMLYLVLSIFRRLLHLSGKKSGKAKTTPKPSVHAAPKRQSKKVS